MSAVLHDEISSTPSTGGPTFARSAEGFPVARLDDLVLAMLPARNGSGTLASAWRVARPLAELRRRDFYVLEGTLSDEAAFRARVHETAEHRRALRGLDRRTARAGAGTPWGSSQVATVYAEGVVSHSTASHGGFCLSPERNAKVPPSLRAADGCYEEDCAWTAVAIVFPELFTAYERRCAERIMMNWEPDAFEAIFGRELQPGESREKDRRAFETRHAGDWIVVAARRSDRHPGMTAVVATLGGQRRFGLEERRFLVRSEEYDGNGQGFGFVIDEARHAACDGPSGGVMGTGEAPR